MADTLETLEIQIAHSASGAAGEIQKVASAIRSVAKALDKALPGLKVFNELMGGGSVTVNNNDFGTTQIADSIKNVTRVAGRARGSIASAADSVRHLSKEASKSKGPLENFVASLKRIAFYRFIRSIIKAITQAFKEGLENAYTFSSGIADEGHRFAAAMDSMKSAGITMKNQLGSAFIALLAAIAPIVNTIIGLVTALANALSQLFAVFTGGTYLKATDASGKLADNMKAGGGAAKEWKNQLLGFDVINKLNDNNGGGGGGGAANNAGLFEDTPISGFFKTMRDKLLELKESLDFGPLINAWEHLKNAVKGFAEVVKGALAWAWENVLVPLAHWTIEQAAPRVVELLAKAFELLTAVLERLKPVFQWIWDNVLKPLAKFVGDAFLKFLDTVLSLLDKLISLLKGETTFKEFLQSLKAGEGILLAIAVAFIVVKGAMALFNGVVTTVFLGVGALNAAIAALTSPIGLVIIALALLVAAFIAVYKHWDQIVAKFKQAGEELRADWERTKEFFRSSTESIKQAFSRLGASIAAPFKQGAAEIRADMERIKETIQSVIDSVKNFVQKLKNLFHFNWELPRIKLPHLWVAGRFSLNPPAVPQFGINWYANGGFPEDGLFMANHGELVGKFANGKTAVANNEMIVEGIKQGVYEAMVNAGQGNNNKKSEVVLNINGREFMRATYNDQKAVAREHGVSLVANG